MISDHIRLSGDFVLRGEISGIKTDIPIDVYREIHT